MHANKIFIDPSASSVLLVEFDCMVSKRAEPSKTILMVSNRIYIYIRQAIMTQQNEVH